MTTTNIEVTEVGVVHNAVQQTTETVAVGENGPVEVVVESVGVAGPRSIHIGPTPPADTTMLWIQL